MSCQVLTLCTTRRCELGAKHMVASSCYHAVEVSDELAIQTSFDLIAQCDRCFISASYANYCIVVMTRSRLVAGRILFARHCPSMDQAPT